MRASFCLLLAGLLYQGASAVDTDQSGHTCRRWGHQTAVVGDRLYIDGGQIVLDTEKSKNETNSQLLFLDLTKTTEGMPPLLTNLTKPPEVASISGGALWADPVNEKLFLYGGEYPSSRNIEVDWSLWSYDIYADNWTAIQPSSDIVRLSYGANTAVESSGYAYQLGGWMGANNDPDWDENAERVASPLLLEYNLVNNTWRNATGPEDAYGRAEGGLWFVPAGDKGMLVAFGGVWSQSGSEANVTAAPMNVVDIYDIANEKWYTQNATGQVPSDRRRFCGGITQAADNSSFNIYIYGGLTFGSNASGIDDAYILSLPSFEWVKYYPNPGTKDNPPETLHYGYSCNVVRSAQMLVIGGFYPDDDGPNKVCDVTAVNNEHNMYLGKQNPEKVPWALFNTTLANYEVPVNLTEVIGGDAQGNAKDTTPENGFDASDLQIQFARAALESAPPRLPTRCPPPSLATTAVTLENGATCSVNAPAKSSDTSSDDSGLSTGSLVAAIVVPVVVGLALIGAIIYWMRRRKASKVATVGAQDEKPRGVSEMHDSSPYGLQRPPSYASPPSSPGVAYNYDQQGFGVEHQRKPVPGRLEELEGTPIAEVSSTGYAR